MQATLSVNRLTKMFGALAAVDDLSFQAEESEILGIVGPNGAGKTTLFGILAGNIRPDAGSIAFRGIDITAMPPHQRARLGVARTYQVPRPFSHMTVFENLMVAARFGGAQSLADARRWVEHVLAMTGLQHQGDTLAGRLLLQQRKRNELARALAIRPKLLLIDEIAAGLTDGEVDQFIALVHAIRESGVTVVWIEHVMKAMMAATDRMIVLRSGRLIASGEGDQVMNLPEVRRVYFGV
jgi:branched-chain amino acid transport system ATP-binding protein